MDNISAVCIFIYLLDEPETGLSPQRQLILLTELMRLQQQGSQIIMATHSPILLGAPDAQIFSFDGGKVHTVAYEETESYQVTSMLVNGRESFFRQMFH